MTRKFVGIWSSTNGPYINVESTLNRHSLPVELTDIGPWNEYVSSWDMVSTYRITRKSLLRYLKSILPHLFRNFLCNKVFPTCTSSTLFNQARSPCHNIPLILILLENDPENSCLGLKIPPFIANGYLQISNEYKMQPLKYILKNSDVSLRS